MSAIPRSSRVVFLALSIATVHPGIGSACQVPGSVNAVIGDLSFVGEFGRLPGTNTAEDLRITTHLAYVEELLRARDVGSWPAHLREARSRNLDRLHAYRTAGSFPRHERRNLIRTPRFIDNMGRICAVGYLIEQSAGRELAETINAQFENAMITEMESEVLEDWIATSGLSTRELAMIQPCYGCMWECLSLEGRAWRSLGDKSGEFRTVGIVDPMSYMVRQATIDGQLTMYISGLLFRRDRINSVDYELYGDGQFGIYEDASSPATYAAHPPNPTTPGSFADGETFLAGTGQFTVQSHASGVFFTGYFTATEGEHLVHLEEPQIIIEGLLQPISMDGYQYLWQRVSLYGTCRVVELVELSSWGRIKATYRSR